MLEMMNKTLAKEDPPQMHKIHADTYASVCPRVGTYNDRGLTHYIYTKHKHNTVYAHGTNRSDCGASSYVLR